MSKKRPNPFLHMAVWGVGSGFLLALLYIVVVLDLLGASGLGLQLLLNPFAWWLPFMIGGVPGATMGLILGFAQWRMLHDVQLPFTKNIMQQKRSKIYSITFITTLILALTLTLIFFSGATDIILFFPPFIAAIASTYAAHRYMFHLRLWSESQQKRKEKFKNEHFIRLLDHQPTEDLSLDNQQSNQKAEIHR